MAICSNTSSNGERESSFLSRQYAHAVDLMKTFVTTPKLRQYLHHMTNHLRTRVSILSAGLCTVLEDYATVSNLTYGAEVPLQLTYSLQEDPQTSLFPPLLTLFPINHPLTQHHTSRSPTSSPPYTPSTAPLHPQHLPSSPRQRTDHLPLHCHDHPPPSH